MHLSRKRFVVSFLAFGYGLNFLARLLLNQSPEALYASPDQQPWQRCVATILSPIRVVLVAPINWLQQDPDPPPPFRVILFAVYWSALAVGIHYLLFRRRVRA